MDDELILVREVYGEIIPRQVFYGKETISILDTRITCILEDNRKFYLERVPPDIVWSLKRINGEKLNDDRERFVDILLSIPDVISVLGKYLKRIVIDNIDERTGTYSATVEFGDGSIVVKRKMVPSHAIFLAKLTNKPIYVRKELVDQQEILYNLLDEFQEDVNEYESETTWLDDEEHEEL